MHSQPRLDRVPSIGEAKIESSQRNLSLTEKFLGTLPVNCRGRCESILTFDPQLNTGSGDSKRDGFPFLSNPGVKQSALNVLTELNSDSHSSVG